MNPLWVNRDDVQVRPDLTEERIRDLDTQSPPPRPPIQFVAEDTKSGVRITIVNDGPLGGRLNGATRYDVYWAETVDTTTAAGKTAGFARATCLAPPIPATNVDKTPSTGFYSDPKYAAGYFYVCGVDAAGRRSEPSEPARVVTGPIDYTIPGDVRHLRISESGKASDSGTVFSELSVTCEAPTENIGNFWGVQLYLKDYLSLGDIQEGYAQKWNGSGGLNFAPLYPIPRRRSSVSVTATNGSANVTAASGLLAVTKAGEQFELLGEKILINTVTDTQITLASNWPKATVTTSDYVIIGKPTIYAVSVSKAGTRRADIENAPSVTVLMDGELSTPNAPSGLTDSQLGEIVRLQWDAVVGSTIKEYRIYRADANDTGMDTAPPRPASTTKFLDAVPQNQSTGVTTGATLEFNDSKFTLYELETNAEKYWYVTTVNIRGDESAASETVGTCRPTAIGGIDPSVPARNPGKNLLYNGMLFGSDGGAVVATDASQDIFMNPTGFPGRPYGSAGGQANGTLELRGHTRWESTDGGTGASGTVTFENGDEIHMPAPGTGNIHYLYQEIGAWGETAGPTYGKINKGDVITVSFYLSHDGVQPNGFVYFYVQQYDDNTNLGLALRRYRDSNSDIQTSASGMTIACSDLTATPTRYQASFQIDSSLTATEQIRINLAHEESTTGVVVARMAMVNQGDVAPRWTAEMGNTNISVAEPVTPISPIDDVVSDRDGDWRRYTGI